MENKIHMPEPQEIVFSMDQGILLQQLYAWRIYASWLKSQVSGATPVAEVQGNSLVPLPNASPTPGPGKVCERCKGDGFIAFTLDGASLETDQCPRCKGSGLEGE
jgi:DnaJ-class molecular chaperone